MLTIKGTRAEINRLCCDGIIVRPFKLKTGDVVRILGQEARLEIVEEEPGWVKRLREEYKELQGRWEKLCDYYSSVIFAENATIGELQHLSMQSDAMCQYARALEKRAEMKGYTLEVEGDGEEC